MVRAAAVALCALVCVLGVSPLFGAGAIFPTPLHLTREVHDPISGKTVVLNEYGYGNRLVSVRGDVTAIADYEKGELTEIDRRAGTYSVTRFETIARLQGNGAVGDDATAALARDAQRNLKAVGAKATRSGHTADFFRAESETFNVEIALDQRVRVSKEALEVLLGTAYPGTRSEQHELVLNAARGGGGAQRSVATNSAQQATEYALPLEQLFAVVVGDERVEFRSSVLRIGNEPPPAEAVAIPAGARLVVSRSSAVLRELETLDAPPLRPPAKP